VIRHAAIRRDRWSTSGRAKLAVALLGTMALVAIFADLLAGARPLVRVGGGHVEIFPGIVERAEADPPPAAFEVWPLVRTDGRSQTPNVRAEPSIRHPLGTDARGRDVFARLVHGTRSAIATALLAVGLSLLLGVPMGALAGFGSARWNRRLERFVEGVDSFPAIVVVALLRAIEGSPSVWSVAAGAALVKWAELARVVRTVVLRTSLEDFVLAARALGASRAKTITGHLLPHAVGPVSVSASLALGAVTLLDTAIAFLGLGPSSDAPTWGAVLAEAAESPDRPWMLAGGALCVGVTVGAAHLLADALRHVNDPRAPRKELSLAFRTSLD
jgi:peptide/nickel transport system permease protein